MYSAILKKVNRFCKFQIYLDFRDASGDPNGMPRRPRKRLRRRQPPESSALGAAGPWCSRPPRGRPRAVTAAGVEPGPPRSVRLRLCSSGSSGGSRPLSEEPLPTAVRLLGDPLFWEFRRHPSRSLRRWLPVAGQVILRALPTLDNARRRRRPAAFSLAHSFFWPRWSRLCSSVPVGPTGGVIC